MTRTSRGRRSLAVLAAAATGLSGVALLGPGTSSASSHREAPYIAGDAEVDNTDVYSFVSPDDPDKVTLIANFWPFEEPDGGPNFYKFDEQAAYDINIDNDGDAVADLTYRYTFSSTYQTLDTFLYNTGVVTSLDDENLNFRQTYDLQLITAGAAPVTLLDDAPVAPSNVGPTSMPDYASLRDEAVVQVNEGDVVLAGASFAGQADDPFFLDLRVFDLLYGGDLSEVGNDTLNGRNVQTIALELPRTALALNGSVTRNPVIGVWSDSERRKTRVLDGDGTSTETGDFVQVSRLGQPLVNEVVIPLKDKDRFNASTPANDAQFLSYVNDPEVPRLLNAIYELPIPDSDPDTEGVQREDLVEVFLTGICTAEAGCPGSVPALEADLNSLILNEDVSSIAPGEMLRLNMAVPPTATPDRLGVIGGDLAGFPNGRRLGDDVIDIALKVVAGALLGEETGVLQDAVDSNDLAFGDSFPFVSLPHNSAVNQTQFTGFDRLAGDDRYATAAAIAQDTFDSADTVILASGEVGNLPDALAGNYLAGFEDAPILLTTRDTLPDVTRRALESLGADRVIVLGGPAAVSAAQADALGAGYDVERIGGRDRYETAALIATTPPASYSSGTAFVARGDQFVDALVAGPVSYRTRAPILLTPSDSTSAFTADALDELGTSRVVIAGGTSAVSDRVAGSFDDADTSVVRLAGQTRQDTAVAIARFATGELGVPRTHVDLARGDGSVDALAGGPHTGVVGGVILLTVGNGVLGDVTEAYLAEESITLEGGDVFGGPAAVSAAVVADAAAAATGDDDVKDPAKQ